MCGTLGKMAAEGKICENLYQQMANLDFFAKFYINKIKPLYSSMLMPFKSDSLFTVSHAPTHDCLH